MNKHSIAFAQKYILSENLYQRLKYRGELLERRKGTSPLGSIR